MILWSFKRFYAMSVLQINIARVAEGEHRHHFEASPSDLELDDSFDGPVRVDVDLVRTGRQYLLEASFDVSSHRICDRCVDPFTLPLAGEYKILYVPDGSMSPAVDDSGEVQTIPADARVISLDEDLRQFIALAVPSKILCREDCRGLCPICGRNLNTGDCSCEQPTTDPRWDVLKKLTNS